MARSTGVYFSGSLAPVASGQRLNFYNVIRNQLLAFLSAGVPAWQEYDNQDNNFAGVANGTMTRNRIFRSLGDRNILAGVGDANLFFQLILRTDNFIYLNSWQDYSTNTHTGQRSALTDTAGGSQAFFTINDTQEVDYTGEINEYEFVIEFLQAGTRILLVFGSQQRTHIAPVTQGIALSTGAVVAGAGVVIPVDRDITASIQVGQQIWVYGTATSGGALASDTPEVCQVSAKAAGSITIGTLANNHPTHSYLGFDPSPMYLGLSTASSAPTLHMTNNLDTTYTGANANNASFTLQNAGITNAANNPATSGQYIGVTAAILPSSGPPGFRGNPQHLAWWPTGNQTDGDRMLPNFDVTRAQKVFPSLLNSSFSVAFGPNAL